MDTEYFHKRLNDLRFSKEEKQNKVANLTPENERKILSLKNKYKAKRCVIVGSSPSIKKFDLSKLDKEITFSVNRGYKLANDGLKHTNFHIMPDVKTFEEDKILVEIPSDFSDIFLIYAGIKFPVEKFNTIFFDYVAHANYDFQNDLTKPLITKGTVIVFALQIAYYLGFEEIYLIGVDLDFKNISGHAYKETQGEKIRQKTESQKTQNLMYNAIKSCCEYLKSRNVKVFNASCAGNVDFVPRVRFDEVF